MQCEINMPLTKIIYLNKKSLEDATSAADVYSRSQTNRVKHRRGLKRDAVSSSNAALKSVHSACSQTGLSMEVESDRHHLELLPHGDQYTISV